MERRIFDHYKDRLVRTANGTLERTLRFNCIEYLCSFPQIDPYEMAAEISKEGCGIVFDDTSISRTENAVKKNKLLKILKG